MLTLARTAKLALASLAFAALPLAAAQAETAEGYVPAGDTITYVATFPADREATVTLIGASSDIDLWIYDENGHLICKSTGYGSLESCSWTPRWTGDFTIVVENSRQPTGSAYELTI